MANNFAINILNNRIINSTISGYKPACLFQIHNTKGQHAPLRNGIDIVFPVPLRTNTEQIHQAYILNKNKVADIIKKNYNLFTLRLDTSKTARINDIYNRLLAGLKNHENISDLEGLTLGFPKFSSMIYHLEKTSGLSDKERKFTEYFKNRLLETLDSKKSPYINLSTDETDPLRNAIKNISDIKPFKNELYFFIQYTKEPAAIHRIERLTKEYLQKTSARNFNIVA